MKRYKSAAAQQMAGGAGITVGAEYLENSDPLTFLHWSASAAAAIEAGRVEAVAKARAAGEPWAAIGMRLGITKQAAQQRYSR